MSNYKSRGGQYTVGIDQIDAAIKNELSIYADNIIDGIKREARSSIKRLVDETKATAPVGHRRAKHYRDAITYRRTEESARSITYTWLVRGSDYRLSHLLEDGHAKRNGGRVEGTHFIRKASVSIIEDYEKAVEEVVRRG